MSYPDVNSMSLRELFNAISGFYRMQEDDKKAMQAIVFGAMRYGAANIAGVWSSQASRQIAKQPFEWERKEKRMTPEQSKIKIEAKLKAWEDKWPKDK